VTSTVAVFEAATKIKSKYMI